MEVSEFKRLLDEDWQWEMQDNPEFASQAGAIDVSPKYPLQDVSESGYRARIDHSRTMLEALAGIRERRSLLPEEETVAKAFQRMHEDIIEAITVAPLYLLPLNSIGAGTPLYSFLESIESMRLESVADFEVLMSRLEHVPTQTAQFIEVMRTGIRRGYVCSKAAAYRVKNLLETILTGKLAEIRDPIEKSGEKLLAEAPELLDRLRLIISDDGDIKKAFQSFYNFFVSEYSPFLREDPAISALPNGIEIYRLCLRWHTTTNLTPEEVHAIGLREVAAIEERYRSEVLIPLGFDPNDFMAFAAYARTEPTFYVSTSEALLDVYRSILNDISEKLPEYFKEFPRSCLELSARTNGPAAYYLGGTADGVRPGRFYVNCSHIEKRPVFEAVSLSLHEGVPGHHHQVSLALENKALPNFIRFIEDRRYEICPCRRNLYSAFVEGWALYCEHLGEEMGVYKNPMQIFGRLSMDMMRSVRLVVDTGLHAMGWTIERSIAYMAEKTGMQLEEVEPEIYRYASWPGQACAYKIGQIEILRLRRLAEEALGEAFNVKDFHSVCLNQGPVSLAVLGEIVEEYIEAAKRS